MTYSASLRNTVIEDERMFMLDGGRDQPLHVNLSDHILCCSIRLIRPRLQLFSLQAYAYSTQECSYLRRFNILTSSVEVRSLRKHLLGSEAMEWE
jgi:hypothetical protein